PDELLDYGREWEEHFGGARRRLHRYVRDWRLCELRRVPNPRSDLSITRVHGRPSDFALAGRVQHGALRAAEGVLLGDRVAVPSRYSHSRYREGSVRCRSSLQLPPAIRPP